MLDQFAFRVSEGPDRPALLTSSGTTSYAELEERSSRIAGALVALDPAGSRPVFILLEDPAAAVTAFIGVLKSGRFGTILDPSFPPDRIDRMARVASPAAWVVESSTAQLCRDGAPRLEIPEALAAAVPDALPAVDPDDPLLIMFTSGSTGVPKAILRTHGDLAAQLNFDAPYNAWPCRVGIFHSLSTAGGILGVLPVLMRGGAAGFYPLRQGHLLGLARWINEVGLTAMMVQPSLFRHLLSAAGSDSRFATVQDVFLAGETITREELVLFRERFPAEAKLWIMYALTEAGAISHWVVPPDFVPDDDRIPVGMPVPGVRVRIEGPVGQEMPPGRSGEIVVSIPFPLRLLDDGKVLIASEADRRRPDSWIVRTGDLGTFRNDGALVHLGRRDRQIKIRGNRIDPAEIELALLADPVVREAAVVGKSSAGGETTLVAYVTTRVAATPAGILFRARLRLPLPMVPSAVHVLDQLPLAPSGKTDWRALEAQVDQPSLSAMKRPADPGTLEAELTDLWSRHLGLAQIGLDDDFFQIGGDSMMAAHIFGELEQRLGREVPMSMLVTAPTVAGQAEVIRRDVLGFRIAVAIGKAAPDAPTLFCIAGGGGNIIGFRPLADALGERVNLYGLQSPFLQDPDLPPDLICAATRCIEAVKEVQPSGPYRLLGNCIGGYMAWEIARQLTAAGGSGRLSVWWILMRDPRSARASPGLVR